MPQSKIESLASKQDLAVEASQQMSGLVRAGKTLRVQLRKDLTRSIKRGHAWLYSDAVEILSAASGSTAILHGRKGEPIAAGIYDPQHPIPLRICRTSPPWNLDDAWLAMRLAQAAELRTRAFRIDTTGYRLVAGEGDRLPGLIIDIYDRVAVIKLDGGAPENFYVPSGIARWLQQHLQITNVVLRSRQRGRGGEFLLGDAREQPVVFLENGLTFTADVVAGQKTGFFLDQRDNRHSIRELSRGRRVLNLFSFNGGFSIAAGVGGATEVTSVDIAAPAIAAAERHWQMNGLQQPHRGIVQDCFEFLEQANAAGEKWDLVICDPPSFAPNERSRERALAAYSRLAQLAASVTTDLGLLALASCSSHIDAATFLQTNLEGIGRARKLPSLLLERGLPIDHPTPMAMPELRYLKFQLLRIEH